MCLRFSNPYSTRNSVIDERLVNEVYTAAVHMSETLQIQISYWKRPKATHKYLARFAAYMMSSMKYRSS